MSDKQQQSPFLSPSPLTEFASGLLFPLTLLVTGCSLALAPIFPDQQNQSGAVWDTLVFHPLQQQRPCQARLGSELSPGPHEASIAVGSGLAKDPLLVGTGFHKVVVPRATEWKTHPTGINANFAISFKMTRILSASLS